MLGLERFYILDHGAIELLGREMSYKGIIHALLHVHHWCLTPQIFWAPATMFETGKTLSPLRRARNQSTSNFRSKVGPSNRSANRFWTCTMLVVSATKYSTLDLKSIMMNVHGLLVNVLVLPMSFCRYFVPVAMNKQNQNRTSKSNPTSHVLSSRDLALICWKMISGLHSLKYFQRLLSSC